MKHLGGAGHFPDARVAVIGSKQEDVYAHRGLVSRHNGPSLVRTVRSRAPQRRHPDTGHIVSTNFTMGRASCSWIFQRRVERPMEIPQRRRHAMGPAGLQRLRLAIDGFDPAGWIL